jgi:hypothetical protein
MKNISFALIALCLSSCATVDTSQEATMVLCSNVLNFPNNYTAVSTNDARLAELDRRGEDCSGYQHLRR